MCTQYIFGKWSSESSWPNAEGSVKPSGSTQELSKVVGCTLDRKKPMVEDLITWWLIPLSKWVITIVISGLTLLIPFISGVITHLLTYNSIYS